MIDKKAHYAEIVMNVLVEKINFVLKDYRTECNKSIKADEVSLVMSTLLNTYEELSKVHMAMLIEELTANVAEQDV